MSGNYSHPSTRQRFGAATSLRESACGTCPQCLEYIRLKAEYEARRAEYDAYVAQWQAASRGLRCAKPRERRGDADLHGR